MNILLDKLPEGFSDGKFRTDFRVFILFELLMKDNLLIDSEKLVLALNLCYEKMPSSLKDAVEGMFWFYSGGQSGEAQERSGEIYSFEKDAGLIYAAFLSEYNIDLTKVKLHWWVFRQLFYALKDDTLIKRIMSIRAMDTDNIKNDEIRNFYEDLKQKFSLDKKSFEESFFEGL